MASLRGQEGFTLVELLLYTAISSAMMLVISVFLSTLLESRIKNQTIAEVEQQGIQVMQIMSQTIRNSNSVTLPTIGTNGSSLTLTVPVGSKNPTVFDLASGVIRIQEGAGSAIPLTNSRVTASALNFQNLSRADTPGNIRIQFTLSYKNNSGRNEYNFSKIFTNSISLRKE